MEDVVLAYLYTPTNKIILGLKKRGFGVGKYGLVGGKPENTETHAQTLLRELQEEIGFVPFRLPEPRGSVSYLFKYLDTGNIETLVSYIYAVQCTEDEVTRFKSTEEIIPTLFSVEHIPYDQMWPDAEVYLQKLVVGQPCALHCEYQVSGGTYSLVSTAEHIKKPE